MMDKVASFSKHAQEGSEGELFDSLSFGSQTAQEWQKIREEAVLTLQQHTAELRDLMRKMHTFTHRTPVETVMAIQSRTAALRWLIQSIEREVYALDKAYRESAQIEQLLQDRAFLFGL